MADFYGKAPGVFGGGGGGGSGPISTVSDTASIDLTITVSDLTADLNLSAAAADAGNINAINSIETDGLQTQVPIADTSTTGVISSADWNTFNNKQAALTIGDLTAAGTDGIAVTGGTGSVIGAGTSIAQQVAHATHNGYLSSADWSTFNGKQDAITIGAFSAVPTAEGLTKTGAAINMDPADATHPGGISLSAQTLGAGTKTVDNLIDSGLTASQAVVTDGSKQLTSLPYGTASSASSLVERDASQNAFANNFVSKGTNVVSASGTTTLTAASTRLQNLTGTTTQTFVLPDATTLSVGSVFEFDNNSTGLLTVNANGGGAVTTVPAGGYARVKATAVPTAAGVWDAHFLIPANSAWGTAGATVTGTLNVTGATTLATSLSGIATATSGVIGAGNLSGDVTSSALVTTLANTAVTPGSYTSADITVDSKGRITAAANGSGGGGSAGIYAAHLSGGTSGTGYLQRSSTSYGDFTITGTVTATEDYNYNFGTVTWGSSGYSVSFTAPATGTIKVKFRPFIQFNAAGTAAANLRLVEATAPTVLGITSIADVNASAYYPKEVEGYFNVTASSSYVFKLQGKSSSNSLTIGGQSADADSNGSIYMEYVK